MGGFFTRNTQFAFGHGGDPASYVKVEPNHFRLVGNGGIALAKIGARWKLAEPFGMQQAINPWKGLLLAMRKSSFCDLWSFVAQFAFLPRKWMPPNFFSQEYFIAPQPVAKNALAANNPVFPDPATLLSDAGLPTSSPGRACPAARATSASPRAPARTLPRAYLSSSSSPEKFAGIGCHHASRITHHFPKNTPKTP